MEKNEVVVANQKQVAVPQAETLVLAGDPEKQMEYAVKSSRVLVEILKQKPKKVMINNEQYLEFEDWQTLGRFYGATVGVEWTKPIQRNGKIWGYEAKAIVFIKGEIVSSAEAMCTRDEKNWSNRDEFALRSMAQTRASAKALRNVLAWVAVLGGFKPTPVEEMPSDMPRQYVPNSPTNKIPDARTKAQQVLNEQENRRRAGIHYSTDEQMAEVREAEEVLSQPAEDIQYDDVPPPSPWDNNNTEPEGNIGFGCSVAGCPAPITDKVRKYSTEKFGKVLCYNHQKSS